MFEKLFKKEVKIKEEPKEDYIFKVENQNEIPTLPDFKTKEETNIRYPLIEPYAYAHIQWDKEKQEVIYKVEEPELTPKEKEILKILEDGVKEMINISFISIKEGDVVIKYLEKNLKILIKELGFNLSKETFLKIMYYIYRDFVGMNEIEPLLSDYFIEDIECNGINSPIYLVHRKYRNLKTNITFDDVPYLASFVEKLAQKCGRYVSYASPLLDGTLPNGFRVNATYTTDVSSKGPTFCFADGYLQLNDGSVKDIKEFFEDSKKNFGSKIEEGNEIVELHNYGCCGVDENTLEQFNSKLNTIIKLKPPEYLVDIKLEDGSDITTTTNHLFHVVNEKLELVEAKDLKEGMFIPVPRKIDVIGCLQTINVANLLKEFSYNKKICVVTSPTIKEMVVNKISNFKENYRNYNQQLSQKFGVHNSYFYEIISRGNSISFEVLNKITPDINSLEDISVVVYGGGRKDKSKTVFIPKTVDEDLAYLCGAMISDGHLSENNIDIATYENGFKEAVTSRLLKKFGKYEVYYNGNRVYLCNSFIPFFFNKVFEIPYGKKSSIVKVPDIIFKSDNKIIASFIRGLFDGDGCASCSLAYKTNSKDLAYGITYLLARLGIHSLVRIYNNQYSVIIPTIYNKIYHDLIGFENIFKKNKLIDLIKKSDKTKSYINHGRIPAEPVLNLIKLAGISKRKLINLLGCTNSYNRFYHDSLSRPFAEDIISVIEKENNSDTKVKIAIHEIKSLLNNNQEYINITSVNIKQNKENIPVYDIELDPCKFFIAGNKPMNVFDTIRQFTKEPWSPPKMIELGTVSPEILAYLWIIIENEFNVMVIGGTGSGKCVTGDTPVYLSNGKKIGIKNIVESKFKLGDIKKSDGWEYSDGDGTTILSLDNNLKISKRPISRFWRHKAPNKLIKITTRSGRTITTTPEHPFFKCFNGKLLKIKAEELTNEERIAVPRFLPYYKELSKQNLIEYIKDEKNVYVYNKTNQINKIYNILSKKYNCTRIQLAKRFGYKIGTFNSWSVSNSIPFKDYYRFIKKAGLKLNNNLILKPKTTSNACKLPEIKPELFRFLALIIGDGHLTRTYVELSNSNVSLLNEFLTLGNDLFGVNGKIKHPKNRVSKAIINSSVLCTFLNKIFQIPYGNKAKIVAVPDMLFEQNEKCVAEFLSGIIDCEGYVSKNSIELTSVSEKLSQGIGTLLLRLGVLSSVIKRPNHFRINIHGYNNINKLNSEISLKEENKKSKLDTLLKRTLAHKTVNLDVFPNLSNFVHSLRINDGLTQCQFAQNIGVSRRLVGMWENGFRNPSIESIAKLNKSVDNTGIKLLSNSDIFWDQVIDVEILKNHEEKYVYDLTVDDVHNFLAGEIPLIVHNTTMLNNLAFFIPQQARVVSIEDTRELNLEHENWLPSVAREGVGLANIVGQKYGEVTLFDLLKESFRQRPDYVIIGEVRGKEAFVLFQGMSSGHPSMGTMHANDVQTMIRRLETPPIELSPSLVESMDAVCIMSQAKVNGKDVRRLREVDEIISVPEEVGKAQMNVPFQWDSRTDTFYFKTDSYIFQKLVNQYGFTKEHLLQEFEYRTRLLVELYKRKIFDYKKVQNVINEYARSPRKVLKDYGIIK